MANTFDSKKKTLVLDTFMRYVLKEPLGLVGLITPWFVRAAAWFVELNINLEKAKMTRNFVSCHL